jgi:cell division cycle 20, cofactor of APC complex
MKNERLIPNTTDYQYYEEALNNIQYNKILKERLNITDSKYENTFQRSLFTIVDLKREYNNKRVNIKREKRRYIQTTPERVLETPDILDDFYINILDCSKTNKVAISLERTVYLFDYRTSESTIIFDSQVDKINSLKFSENGEYLSIGTEGSEVFIFDIATFKIQRKIKLDIQRIYSLSWYDSTLSCGGYGSINMGDVRTKEFITHKLNLHEKEVCSIK